MTKRERWLGATALIGVGLFGLGGGLWIDEFSLGALGNGLAGINAGEWLQAGAGFAGVAATVAATLWIEDWRRKSEVKAQYRHIKETLTYLQEVIGTVRECDEQRPDNVAQFRDLLMTQYMRMRLARGSFLKAKSAIPIRSLWLWASLDAIESAFVHGADMLTNEERIVRGNGVTAFVASISQSKITELAARIQNPLLEAISILETEMA